MPIEHAVRNLFMKSPSYGHLGEYACGLGECESPVEAGRHRGRGVEHLPATLDEVRILFTEDLRREPLRVVPAVERRDAVLVALEIEDGLRDRRGGLAREEQTGRAFVFESLDRLERATPAERDHRSAAGLS